jgi:hypothetical protein
MRFFGAALLGGAASNEGAGADFDVYCRGGAALRQPKINCRDLPESPKPWAAKENSKPGNA